MSNTNNTPGPWRTDVPDPAFVNYLVRTDHKIICTMGIDMAVEEEAANASLIAAAPELLEAVQLAHDLQVNGSVDFKKYGLTCDADIAAKFAQAIAKATQP